jgi:Zn-dependent protease
VNTRAFCLVLLLMLLVPVSSAFDLRQVSIRIEESGDAVITAVHDENPAEYLGLRSASMAGTTLFEKQVFSGPVGDVSILCSDYGVTMLRVRQFAQVTGSSYETPLIEFSTPLSLSPEVTIIFPDGYYEQQTADGAIRPVVHTLGAQTTTGAPQPERQCRAKKDLPLSGILPDELAPAASVAAAITLTAAAAGLAGGAINLWFGNLIAFLEEAAGDVIANRLQEKGKEGRTLDYYTERRAFLGFSVREVIVLIAGSLLIGILFFYATRDPPDPAVIAIYIFIGGVALILHEVGHWYVTRRYASYTEVKFWGMGAVIMVLTAWLCGNVFAQPTLTMARHHQKPDRRSSALIMLAGPAVSVLIALACLCLVPFGGTLATAGMIGFMINLTTGIFELLPIPPCDGSEIRQWNPAVWVLVFLPLMILYLAVTF